MIARWVSLFFIGDFPRSTRLRQRNFWGKKQGEYRLVGVLEKPEHEELRTDWVYISGRVAVVVTVVFVKDEWKTGPGG